jgi:hypothetical protein
MKRYYHSLAARAIAVLCAGAGVVRGQTLTNADSVTQAPNYWHRVTMGVATSILLHEAAHIGVSLTLGTHPTFGFDKFRPTVYSGLNIHTEPRKQFVFSAAGLITQAVIDEAILDVPHARGSAFERGVIGGGIGTTLFYITVGQRGSVSDIEYIVRTHVMNTTQATLIFGSVAAMHAWRVSRNPAYANFFARPNANGGLSLGWSARLP